MDQVGKIVKTKKNMATIDIRRTSACGDKCGSCSGGCDIPAIRVDVPNTLDGKVGDYVGVEMATKAVLKSAFIAYMVPLIMLITGISLGMYGAKLMHIEYRELLGLVNGVLFLVVAHSIIKAIDRKIQEKNALEFKMVKIVSHGKHGGCDE